MRGRIVVEASERDALSPIARQFRPIATDSPFFDEVHDEVVQRPIDLSCRADEDYVVVLEHGPYNSWRVNAESRLGHTSELDTDSADLLFDWFRKYRARLGHPEIRRGSREASRFLDLLGALLQQHDELVDLLAQALADRDAAERRADMLQRELDQLRAANAEPHDEARRTMWLGIATVVISALTGLGGFATGTAQAHTAEHAARIAQETALTQTIIEQTAKTAGPLPTDPRQLADAVREAAERLRLACQ